MKSAAISFGNTIALYPSDSQQQDKKDKTVKYTAEAGTAGFGVVAARNYAQKKGIITQMVNNAAQRAATAAKGASNVARMANKNAKEASSLLGSFFKNTKIFAEDIMARLVKLKSNKFLKPIIESPVTKKAAGALGGVFAFFVLITGITESVRNGKLAVNDAKEQWNSFRNVA